VDGSIAGRANGDSKWCIDQPDADGAKWIKLDLGKSYEINRWVIYHADGGHEPDAYNTRDFKLQRSDDGDHWRDIDAVIGNSENVTDRTVTPFTARYVRLYIMKPTQQGLSSQTGEWGAVRIYEIELYNTRGGTPVTGVSVSPTVDVITGYGKLTLSADIRPHDATNKVIIWSTDNPAIAVRDGIVYANGIDNATITATTQDGGKKASCRITVTPVAASGLSVLPTLADIAVKGNLQLTKIVAPRNATDKVVHWNSSNPVVATVNRLGCVTGVAAGNAVITGTAADGGFTATCRVTVYPIDATRQADRVRDFLNSLGVNTHIGQGEDNISRCAEAIKYAGIRNIREDGRPGFDWSIIARAGIGMDMGAPVSDNISDILDRAKGLKKIGVNIIAIEGPNEPNNWAVKYEGEESGENLTAQPIARFQRDMYESRSRAARNPDFRIERSWRIRAG
jgi:hypothetical protein